MTEICRDGGVALQTLQVSSISMYVATSYVLITDLKLKIGYVNYACFTSPVTFRATFITM